ncbi:MAG: NADH-quinone oxidoreductase subunit M [Bacilli bacterium]|nr:NADH-quinone oxidoreductase subunit M [Bacilli bacterium]MBN2877324.1 NADH-quinone oxidoreductase subunit M [Bacilli bacterium]
MASIELLILFLVGAGLIAYLLTKVNTFLGSIFTIFAVMFVFVSLAAYGFNMNMDTVVNYLPGISFSQTYLGFYFAIIIVFVYLMVSFFHPYYLNEYKYKDSYNLLFLLSLAGILGAFYTDNFLNLFFFFELIIWTTMFLIPQGKSREAAVSYFGFSVAGSVAMLIGIFVIFQNNGNSFDIATGLAALNGTNAIFVFILFLIAAFAKLGSFPLHIWLPIAHGNAPHPFSPVLSGALVKLGAFIGVLALIRIAPATGLFVAMDLPIGQYVVALLGSASIVFGTLMAIKEDDAKKLLAYSSMSHGGYILVAFSILNGLAFAGGFYHILAHALASAGAFMAIAAVARATGTTKMKELGGMIHKMPITYLAYLVAIISMAGIPPMGGFISKWLIFQAVINKGMVFVGIAVFFGSVGSFLYVFRPLAALFLGQEFREYKGVKEAPILMLIPTFIIMGLNVYTGVFPAGILEFINKIIVELGYTGITVSTYAINGSNGILNPALISLVFAIGVAIAFVIFIVLKKSRKVDLMDTYTAANFVHDEHLLHYSVDFYAPLERLYEKQSSWMKKFYTALAEKVKELGKLGKYLFMSKNVATTLFWIVAIIIFLLWGEVL